MSKSSKLGKNKAKCQRYKDMGTRIFNRRRKLTKHLNKHSEDLDAKKCLKSLTI